MKSFRFLFSVLFCFLLTISSGSSEEPNAEEPKELTRLKETFQREMRKVTAPVDEKYLHALERLQKQLAAANKLDEALEVRNVIAKVKSAEPGAPSLPNSSAKKEFVSLRSWSGD